MSKPEKLRDVPGVRSRRTFLRDHCNGVGERVVARGKTWLLYGPWGNDRGDAARKWNRFIIKVTGGEGHGGS